VIVAWFWVAVMSVLAASVAAALAAKGASNQAVIINVSSPFGEHALYRYPAVRARCARSSPSSTAQRRADELWPRATRRDQPFVAAFRDGLLTLGWVQGRNIRSDYGQERDRAACDELPCRIVVLPPRRRVSPDHSAV
jgi:hypothetical protein